MRLTTEQLLALIKEAAGDKAPVAQIQEASKQLNLDDSQSGLYSKLQRALSQQFQNDGSSIWPWVQDVFGDNSTGTIVYRADNKLYSATYKVSGDAATLGKPARVMLAYVPSKSPVQEALTPNCPENADLFEIRETELCQELVPIREAALSTEGKGLLKLVAAGQGSSRFYPKGTLQKAAESKVFPKGTQMFMDHQTDAEERARPEGSIKGLMGVLEADADYREQGPDGPGLYAPVHVYSDYVGFLNERSSDIGASIRAMGRSRRGQVAGVNTDIVEELVASKSVDFVTRPGAGGKLVPLYESYREANPGKFKVSTTAATSRNEEQGMTEQEKQQLATLQESVTKMTGTMGTLQTENATLRESAVRSQAQVIVTRKLAACKLPDKAKLRIESYFESAVLPKAQDGSLDKTVLESQVDTQVANETTYLKECSATGVQGLGESRQEPTQPDAAATQKTFQESVSFLAGTPQKEGK